MTAAGESAFLFGATTFTSPTMFGWITQWYSNDPVFPNVTENGGGVVGPSGCSPLFTSVVPSYGPVGGVGRNNASSGSPVNS